MVGLNSTVFTKSEVAITFPRDPSPKDKPEGFSTRSIVGIAIGCTLLLLLLVATSFMYLRKRRENKLWKRLHGPHYKRSGARNNTALNGGASTSPQNSPRLKDDAQISLTPKVRNFSLSKQLPHLAGQWHRAQPSRETYSPSLAQYQPPQPVENSVPAHDAYIPPAYTPPYLDTTSSSCFPMPPSPSPKAPQLLPAIHLQRISPPDTVSSHPQKTLPSELQDSGARGMSDASSVPSNGQEASTGRSESKKATCSPASLGYGVPRETPSTALSSHPPTRPSRTLSLSTRKASFRLSSMVTRRPSSETRASHSRHNSTIPASQTQSLGERRACVLPLVQTAASVARAEEQATQARERHLRAGLGGTQAHGPEETSAVANKSPSSVASEELWPGTY